MAEVASSVLIRAQRPEDARAVVDVHLRSWRRFYEAAGCHADGETKIEERPGATLNGVRYVVSLDPPVMGTVADPAVY